MVAKIKTFTFIGIDAIDINVEVKLSAGIVAFNIVGLPDKAVNEAKERVRASINSIGLNFPIKRLTINLSPADLNKEGSYLDLPMALGLLVEMEIIKQESVDNFVVLGELSLDGTINKVNGILPATIKAKENGLGIICPKSCLRETRLADEEINVIVADNLLQLVNHLNNNVIIKEESFVYEKNQENNNYPDLKDVYGQYLAKKAIEISAAGGHNLLLIGPPGTGKSMLAERMLGILPELTKKEMLEINIINSIAGKISENDFNIKRPFFSPHHSCSTAAMVGGGSKPKPGQITLSHNGILFLDELPEFSSQVLDSLRQPLENGKVSIARAIQQITYPADFQLIGAMNPCRCGFYGVVSKQCKRAPYCAQEYQNRISGPLLDRFDLFVSVDKIDIFEEKKKAENNENSATVKKRVEKAREIQYERYKEYNIKRINAKANNDLIKKYMKLDQQSEKILQIANEKYNFSIRSFNKIIKVARTIADLQALENIEEEHILEALNFKENRFLVNNY